MFVLTAVCEPAPFPETLIVVPDVVLQPQFGIVSMLLLPSLIMPTVVLALPEVTEVFPPVFPPEVFPPVVVFV